MPIKKPADAKFSGKHFVMLLWGLPGVGKSTLALSAPRPFYLDVDQGAVRVRREHLKDYDDSLVYKDLLATLAAVRPNDYDTIIIDTVGALIRVQKAWAIETDAKTALKKDGGFAIGGFGIIKSEFIRLVDELRVRFNVILVFHAVKEKDGDRIYYDLDCEGAAKIFAWQPADLGAYMYIDNDKRMLGFTPTDKYSAKSGHGVKGLVEVPELPKGTPNVFLTDLFATVRANIAAEDAAGSQEYAKYDEIMKAAAALIPEIKDIDSITPTVVKIKALGEALTSASEVRARISARLTELGIAWDKEAKKYVCVKQPEPPAAPVAAPAGGETADAAKLENNDAPGLGVGAYVPGGGIL